MNKLFLYCLLIVGSFFTISYSQEETEFIEGADIIYRLDSVFKEGYITHNPIYPRTFEEGFQEKYVDSNFDYERTKPETSLWQKIKNAFNRIFSSLFDDTIKLTNDVIVWVLRVLFILIIAIVGYFLIRYFLQKEGNWIFDRKQKEVNYPFLSPEENLHNLHFPSLVAQAEEEKNYRMAIRYLFLWILKEFTDKELIEWNPEKTNRDYLKKLSKTPHFKLFKELIYIFEYVWYGERDISEKEFLKYKSKFKDKLDKI